MAGMGCRANVRVTLLLETKCNCRIDLQGKCQSHAAFVNKVKWPEWFAGQMSESRCFWKQSQIAGMVCRANVRVTLLLETKCNCRNGLQGKCQSHAAFVNKVKWPEWFAGQMSESRCFWKQSQMAGMVCRANVRVTLLLGTSPHDIRAVAILLALQFLPLSPPRRFPNLLAAVKHFAWTEDQSVKRRALKRPA